MSASPTPSVSVVIPTYNRRHSLPNALESVLRQTYSDIEVIVVDDCSTDDTMAYLESVADPRLRVIRHAVNKGAGGARNTGIAAARAPMIAFQDSDDEWLVSKLARQMAAYEKAGSPDFGAVYCGKVTYGEGEAGRRGRRLVSYAPRPEVKAEGDILQSLLRESLISTQTLLVRKDLLDAIGGFDESLRIGEDWELAIRLARHTRFVFIDEPLGMCFLGADSINIVKINQVQMRQRMLEKNMDMIAPDPALHAEYLRSIARVYQRHGRWRESLPFARQAVRARIGDRKSWAALMLAGAMSILGRRGAQ